MKIFLVLTMILAFMNTDFGQNLKVLIADGTADIPKKYELEPTIENLPARETEAVKKAVLEKNVEFSAKYKAMSSEESVFRKDFELLDVSVKAEFRKKL